MVLVEGLSADSAEALTTQPEVLPSTSHFTFIQLNNPENASNNQPSLLRRILCPCTAQRHEAVPNPFGLATGLTETYKSVFPSHTAGIKGGIYFGSTSYRRESWDDASDRPPHRLPENLPFWHSHALWPDCLRGAVSRGGACTKLKAWQGAAFALRRVLSRRVACPCRIRPTDREIHQGKEKSGT